jgi:hypothetical protein
VKALVIDGSWIGKIRYPHPNGAVIWINLDPDVAAAVAGESR